MVPIMCMSRKDMHMHAALGMINGHGYDGQQKYIICDACRQCHLILCILKPIFRQILRIHHTYNSLRYLNLQIWQFLCP